MMFKVLLTAVLLAVNASAFWRLECRGRVGLARVDPLVAFGKASAHVHAIHGSSGFSETATYDDLLAANCTSCGVLQDKSAYWHPALYFHDFDTGEYELVRQVGGMLVYYLLFTNPGESKVTAFPKGFHMIAGNNERDTYTVGDVYSPDPEKSLWKQLGQTTQVDLKQRAVGFNCMHYGKDPEGTLYRHYLPDKEYLDANCPDGVRFELMFPSCWNGRDLDTLDHQSHMAYPDLVMGGYCPPEFPIRTASMLFETIWDTNAFNGRKGEFVASNGDKKGFAYHGDFMMGWESEEFLQQAIDTCTDDSGEQAKCPLFSIQDEYQSGQCKMPTPADLANDKLEGPGLRALPGGVQDVGHQPAPPISSVTYSPGIKPTDSQLLPGQVFHPSDIPAPLQNAPPAETPPPVSYQAVSTQLVSATNIVTEVVWEQAIAYVTEEVDVVTTVTVAGAPPKLKARRRAAGHVRRHGHHGHGL